MNSNTRKVNFRSFSEAMKLTTPGELTDRKYISHKLSFYLTHKVAGGSIRNGFASGRRINE